MDYVDPPPLNISSGQASFVDIFVEVLVCVDENCMKKPEHGTAMGSGTKIKQIRNFLVVI